MQRTILSSAHAFWSKLPEISYTNYKCRSSVFGVSPSEANNTSLFRPTTAARLEETNQQKTCFQVFVQKLRNSQIASGLEQFVMARRLVQKWQQYKYRFVPWIAMNLGCVCVVFPSHPQKQPNHQCSRINVGARLSRTQTFSNNQYIRQLKIKAVLESKTTSIIQSMMLVSFPNTLIVLFNA